MTSESWSSDGRSPSRERIPLLYLAPWVDFGGSDKGTIDWFRWLDRDRFAPSLITTQPSSNRRLVEVSPFAEEVWVLPECMAGPEFPMFIFDFLHTRDVPLVHIMNARLAYELLPDLKALDEAPAVVVQLHVEEPDRAGFVRYVATRYGNLVDGFSVVSRHLATVLEHDYDVPRSKIKVIPLGVDAVREFNPELVKPTDREREKGTFQILVAGRLHEQKDPLLMVEVAKRVIARHDHVRVEVVGDGPLESDVRHRVSELGLEERIRFHPPTPELAGWLADSDLLLMTSIFEGIPLVAYEALAMGVPVVASALPGNVELMADGGGCLIERRDDPNAYAEAITAIIEDKSLRREIGVVGRTRMLESFTVQGMARDHERLYEKLLAGRKRRPTAYAPARPAPLRFNSRPIGVSPPVSIITPCYNHGRYLPSLLEGVAAQDYPSIEVIIVDDGSDDPGTLEQLSRLEQDGSARVIRQPRNRGPSAARNRALDVATGRYILPVDADNVLLPGAVRGLVQQLQGAGERVGYVYPSYQYFGNRDYCFRPPTYNHHALLSLNFTDTCSLLDREIFDAGLRYPEDIELGHEDWDLVLELAARDVIGEPSRSLVMLYRKHGFTRSDLVEYARLPFRSEIKARHPELFGSDLDEGRWGRWRGPALNIKARSNPALSLIAAEPIDFDSIAGQTLLRALADQRCRDFEFIVECSALAGDKDLVVRRLPPGLAGSVAERIEEALSMSRGRYLLVTRSPEELLADLTIVERLLRAFTSDPELRAAAFADLGDRHGRFPWALIERADTRLAAHAVGWRRELHRELAATLELDEGREVEKLAWAIDDRVDQMQWRHFPLANSGRSAAREHRRPIALERKRPPTVLERSKHAEYEERMQAYPAIPTVRPHQVPRWGHSAGWMPPETVPLVRHVDESGTWRVITNSLEPPPGARVECVLGAIQHFSPPGTRRLIRRGRDHLTVERESPRNDEDIVLGYLEEAPLPLFVGIERAVLQDGSETLVVGAERDHLRLQARELTFLGFIESLPNEPAQLPPYTETSDRRILVRWIDHEHRRHTYEALTPSHSSNGRLALGAELGRLQLYSDSTAIPLWLDAAGRISTDRYSFTEPPLTPAGLLRYSAAPLNWRGFGRHSARLRATFRRLLDSGRLLVAPPRRKHPDRDGRQLLGYLQSEPGPRLIELFAARHRVLPDQFVTHHPLQATDMGYVDLRSIGYIQAVAPLTGALGSKGISVPWASHFGLTARVDDLSRRGQR